MSSVAGEPPELDFDAYISKQRAAVRLNKDTSLLKLKRVSLITRINELVHRYQLRYKWTLEHEVAKLDLLIRNRELGVEEAEMEKQLAPFIEEYHRLEKPREHNNYETDHGRSTGATAGGDDAAASTQPACEYDSITYGKRSVGWNAEDYALESGSSTAPHSVTARSTTTSSRGTSGGGGKHLATYTLRAGGSALGAAVSTDSGGPQTSSRKRSLRGNCKTKKGAAGTGAAAASKATRGKKGAGAASTHAGRAAGVAATSSTRHEGELRAALTNTSDDATKQAYNQASVRYELMSELERTAPPVYVVQGDICHKCNTAMIILASDALLGCPTCSYTRLYIQATSSHITYGEEVEFANFSYKRINHFQVWCPRPARAGGGPAFPGGFLPVVSRSRLPPQPPLPHPPALPHPPHSHTPPRTPTPPPHSHTPPHPHTAAPTIRTTSTLHLQEWLNTFQAKESSEVPESIIEAVMEELYVKTKARDASQITQKKVRETLKDLKLRKYYDHTPQITTRITGVLPPRMTPFQAEQVKLMFSAIQGPFTIHCPPERTNFLSYGYCLFKFCELMGYDEFLPCFTLLKGQDKLVAMDRIWKKICNELDWEFIPSA